MPEIRILQQSTGAREAKGLTVIIDVFRAFTTVLCMVEKGAEKIIPVTTVEEAISLKENNPSYFLFGERKGVKFPEADYGNSPSETRKLNLNGRSIIFTTSAGTRGFNAAVNASELLTGSFCNAGAIVRYIREKSPECVSLVCMGHRDERPADEDTLCAEYIKGSLKGKPLAEDYILKTLSESADAKKFFDPAVEWARLEDYYLCTGFNRYKFVLRYNSKNAPPLLTPFYVD